MKIEDALLAFTTTPTIGEVIHPYSGGQHVFRYEEAENGERQLYLDLGRETYSIDRGALISAIKKIPGGSDAMATWPPYMVMEPLNHFFDQKKGDFKALVDGENIIVFTRPDATVFRPAQVLDIMTDTLARHCGHGIDTLEIDNFAHDMLNTTFTVVDPEGPRFVDAKRGDRTLGAIGFAGNVLGTRPLEVSIRTRRVSCSNGMVSPDGVSRFKAGNEDEEAEGGIDRLVEWLRTETEGLYSGENMERELERIEHLTAHAVDAAHIHETLDDLYMRFSVPARTQDAITEALAEEADGTMYGVVQAFTRAAQHSPNLEEAARFALMRTAGAVTGRAHAICESCQRVLT